MITETIAFYTAVAIISSLIYALVGHFEPIAGYICAFCFAASSAYARHAS